MPKSISVLGASLSAFGLAAAVILQYFFEIEPCALCLLQRYLFVVITLSFGLGVLIATTKLRLLNSIITFSLVSLNTALSLRHLWLLNQPIETITSCVASIDRLLTKYSWWQTIRILLQGSAGCAEDKFKFLGLNIPEMSLGLNLILLGVIIFGWLHIIKED